METAIIDRQQHLPKAQIHLSHQYFRSEISCHCVGCILTDGKILALPIHQSTNNLKKNKKEVLFQGHICITREGIELSKKPTIKQQIALVQAYNRYFDRSFWIRISDAHGMTRKEWIINKEFSSANQTVQKINTHFVTN